MDRTSIFLYIFLTFSVMIVGFYCIPQGSKCRNSNSPGMCIPVTDCPSALEAIRLQGYHDLKRCGFANFTEIICCSDTELRHVNTTTDGNVRDRDDDEKLAVKAPSIASKSLKACESYSKTLPIALTYHIVGGENAELGEFPHMAALGFYSVQEAVYKFDCGGTLISNRYIVTAAHCVINVEQNDLKIVRLGVIEVPASVDKPDPTIDYNVNNVTVHKEYNWREKFNDIALVKLEKKVTFTDNIRPACLYTKNDDPQKLLVTGWGAVSLGGDRSTVLQKATLTPVSLQECNTTYLTRTKRNVLSSQICAADDRSDACQGDSGGPLQTQNNASALTIVGITSYGIGCGSKYPGIYTRINSYLGWIEGIVWP